ncbi:MAG: hypothetical protein BWK73_45635 [Thiothrix lacustris]|uniref:Uncharacterized protein n=1 Tax=Thiothrix lacustris TaxID=525917 RepID=A0A1Y1QB42_9GAMM|nr:MAG: hypothetical protein BWK73_45635 [Thiothrix lacustris]
MKFEHLAGKRALGIAYSKDYADWAESLLHEDIESENVAILASIGLERNPDSEEIEVYFKKSLTDLNLVLPSEVISLAFYAKALCHQIVLGDVDPKKGLGILEACYSKSGYKTIYSIWEELAEDLWMVNAREHCIFNAGLTKENASDYIKSVAAQFIVLLESELPEDFFHLSACPECGYIGKSEYKAINNPWMPAKLFKFIYKHSQTQMAICLKCKKPFPKNMSDYEGREQYLNKITNKLSNNGGGLNAESLPDAHAGLDVIL